MIKVVCSAVIKNSKGEVLAVHLNKEKPEGVWVTPGGKLEEGETCRECVIRECREELGIEIEIENIIGISEVAYQQNEYWTFILFKAKIIKGEPKPMEAGKTLACKYIPKEKLSAYEEIRWLES